jgi:Tol biopolymer transport system component
VKLNAPLVENGDVDGLIQPAFQIDPAAQRVVYRADQAIDEAHELFSVPIEGGPALRLHAPLPPGPTSGTVRGFSFVSGGRDVLFQATGDRDDVIELYRVPLAGGADERINTPLEPGAYVVPEPLTSADGRWVVYQTFVLGEGNELFGFDLTRSGAPIPLSEDLPGGSFFQFFLTPDAQRVVFEATSPAFKREVFSRRIDGSEPAVQLSAVHAGTGDGALRLSPDGSRAVYQGNHESIANRELFSAPVDGSEPRVRVSGVLPSWGSVVETSSLLEAFQVAPNSRWAVFLADRDRNDQVELYGAPVDGSRAPVQLSGTLPLLGDMKSFAISPAGSRAVYVADQDRNDRDELFSVPLFGAPSARSTRDGARLASVKLNGPLATGTSVGSFFRISPLGDFVVFIARQRDDAEHGIYSVAIDGSSPPRRLGASSATWRFTPDGRRLVYCAGQDSPWIIELYSVPLDGSEPAVKLNAPLPQGGNVVQYGVRGESAIEISPDGRTVVYMADQRQDERFEIFAVDVEGHAPPVVVNAPLATGRDVGGLNLWSAAFRITPDGREVVYLADHDANDIIELYAAPLP